MTKADEFKSKRKADYASAQEFFDILLSVDPESSVKATDLGPIICFSDGSVHRMSSK